MAAKYAQLDVIKALANRFPEEVDAKGGAGGKTALHVAVYHGQLDAVDLLLSCGASLRTRDDDGDGALHYAAHARQATVARFLLERGSAADAANEKGEAALHLSVALGDEGTAIALLEGGADPNSADGNGASPMHEAVVRNRPRSFLELLQSFGGDFAQSNKRGFNCAHLAALKGHSEALNSVLQLCPQLVNASKPDGVTSLHIACLNGRIECVKVLLSQGDPSVSSARDKTGRTPLHHACARGFYAIAEMLLNNGGCADAGTKDYERVTPLHVLLDPDLDEQKEREDSDCPACAVNEAMLGQAKKAGVPAEDERRAALGALLILSGADATTSDDEGRTPFDYVTNPETRTYFMEVSLQAQRSGSCEVNPVGGTGTAAAEPSQEQEVRKQTDRRSLCVEECWICSEQLVLVVFSPCGHRVACANCAERMKKCLECKQEIREKRIQVEEVEEEEEEDQVKGEVEGRKVEKDKGKVRELEAKVRDLEESNLCLICMERKRDLAFLCGHQACSECGESLTVCHMCRKPVGKKIHLF